MTFSVTWKALSDSGNDAIAGEILGIFSREERGKLSQRAQIVDLYDELRSPLYGYLICMGLTPQEADDVIQDAFLRLVRFLQDGGTLKSHRSWIFRVAHNLGVNLQKRERRLVADSDEDGAIEFARSVGVSNPEELYLRKEQLRRLDAAISQLTRRQRECLHLRAEGLRYHEIAEVLGITISGVADSLRRAILHLMSELYE
jgi:RNA polymerase sigma-70 factor (ECF subfamily)